MPTKKNPFSDAFEKPDLAQEIVEQARKRRSPRIGPLRGVRWPRQQLNQRMLPTVAVLDERLRRIGPLSTQLPQRLPAEQRRLFRRFCVPDLGVALLALGDTLRRWIGPPVPGLPQEGRCTEIAARLSLYADIRRVAGRGLTLLMDQRLIQTTCAWHMYHAAQRHVVALCNDQRRTVEERNRVRRAFFPLFLYTDERLRRLEELRRDRKQARAAGRQRQREERRLDFMWDVMFAIRMGYQLDRQTLLAAALIYRDYQQKQGAPDPAGTGAGRA